MNIDPMVDDGWLRPAADEKIGVGRDVQLC
jgi:hypothetical protein